MLDRKYFTEGKVVRYCPREYTCCRGMFSKSSIFGATGYPCVCSKLEPGQECERDIVPSFESLRPYKTWCP